MSISQRVGQVAGIDSEGERIVRGQSAKCEQLKLLDRYNAITLLARTIWRRGILPKVPQTYRPGAWSYVFVCINRSPNQSIVLLYARLLTTMSVNPPSKIVTFRNKIRLCGCF